MSNQPPPPPPPGGPPPGPPGPPYGPAPRRRRPRGVWFLVPGALIVAGLVMVVAGFVSALGPLTSSDGVVPADGSPQEVELDDDSARLLLGPEDQPAPDCVVIDPGSRDELTVEPPGASYTVSDGSGSWAGFGTVEPRGTTLELTCTGGEGAEVRVGPSPGGLASLFGGLGLVFGGVGVGGVGVVLLILLVVLYATGTPRRST